MPRSTVALISAVLLGSLAPSAASASCLGAFWQQPSYPASGCSDRPPGSVCVGFGFPGYIWLIEDGVASFRQDSCEGKPVDVAVGYAGEYHHLPGTDLVKFVPLHDTGCMSRFFRQPSFPEVSCPASPAGDVCATFSDGFSWLLRDSLAGSHATFCEGIDVQVRVGARGEYHHIPGTNKVAFVPVPDTTPPDTTIASGPSGTIAAIDVDFTWHGTDNVTLADSLTYAFRLDPLEPAFSAFGSATATNYTGLGNGNYTFLVKARDAAGNEDASPASRSFTVGAPPALLSAAVLPSSRSVQIATPATAFVTVINGGASTATDVGIGLSASATLLPIAFSFQTTDPSTNALTGTVNTAVDIPAGGRQSYVVSLSPTGPIDPTDVAFVFAGTNTLPVPTLTGINTLLLSASSDPVADVVALAATLNNDGIVNVPGPVGTGVFAVAVVNVGATATITATADTGSVGLPVTVRICQTNPATGDCLAWPPAASVTEVVGASATPAFGIFVESHDVLAFDPAANRIFVRFKDESGALRGSTSVAVRTQ